MDLMQMAGHLSLESGAVVTGPWNADAGTERQASVMVMRPDGYGVMLMMGPGKGLAPESVPGGLDVWQIRETPDPDVYDIGNARDMIRYNTDLDGARAALRETGPDAWAKKDTPPARCEICGK